MHWNFKQTNDTVLIACLYHAVPEKLQMTSLDVRDHRTGAFGSIFYWDHIKTHVESVPIIVVFIAVAMRFFQLTSGRSQVVNIPNSMTVLPELLPLSIEMVRSWTLPLYSCQSEPTCSHHSLSAHSLSD